MLFQDQIDKNNKLADARLKALDAAKQEADLGNEIAKAKAKYDAAIATGNSAEAQQASLDMAGLQKQLQYNSQKKAIEDGITDLKKSLEGADAEDIKKKTQSLIQVSMKLGEAVYKSQQKPEASNAEGEKSTKPNDKENVVDADFEEVKEEDKEKSA